MDEHVISMMRQNLQTVFAIAAASWSAVAERSGDTAFVRAAPNDKIAVCVLRKRRRAPLAAAIQNLVAGRVVQGTF
jgi:hypothetical protein